MAERTPNHILMGVSACGKTTLGRALAEVIGARFVDLFVLQRLVGLDPISRVAAAV